MTSPRTVSHLLSVAVALAVVALDLGPAALAGLLSFTILDISHRFVAQRLGRELRWTMVVAFIVLLGLAGWAVVYFVKGAVGNLPAMLAVLRPQLERIAAEYHMDASIAEFANVDKLVGLAAEGVSENVEEISKTGGLLTESVFRIIVGIGVAIFAFTSPVGPDPGGDTWYDQLRREVRARVAHFLESFERVFGAQVAISAINTTLTAIYLAVIGIPNLGFLVVATFLLGLLPIVGNLLSNTLIVVSGLTVSLEVAVASLVYLVVIHKLEYFLNSRIVGASIRLPMWQTLIGILTGEALLGVPGIVMAPAIIHYVLVELRGTDTGR